MGMANSVRDWLPDRAFYLLLRRNLNETAEYTERKEHPTLGQSLTILLANWRVVIAGC